MAESGPFQVGDIVELADNASTTSVEAEMGTGPYKVSAIGVSSGSTLVAFDFDPMDRAVPTLHSFPGGGQTLIFEIDGDDKVHEYGAQFFRLVQT